MLAQNRDLLWLWTAREVRVRYKQSLLGVAWAVVQPLALTLIFTLVFTKIVSIDTGDIPYPVFSYAALVPWTLLATSLTFSIPSLVNNMQLVSKIFFPREILPLASIGAALFDFAISFTILLVMLVVFGFPLTPLILWILPMLAIELTLAAGVGLIGAAVIVFLRDVRFVVPLALQVWMYASPVIYPIEMVPEKWRTLYFLNPMAGIIDGYRRVLLMGETPNIPALAIAAVVSLTLLVVGYLAFKRLEPSFADLI